MTLRNSRVLPEPVLKQKYTEQPERSRQQLEPEQNMPELEPQQNLLDSDIQPRKTKNKTESDIKYDDDGNFKGREVEMFGEKILIPPPFPGRLARPKKEDKMKEIFNIFRKVEINIPLLDAIDQIPKYAKFLKEQCTKKTKLQSNAKVSVSANVSAVIQRQLPPKCGDPGMYSIPVMIDEKKVDKAMIDLGASINIMSLSLYKKLNLGPMKETRIIIQLANRSTIYPEGMMEDMLVKVKGLIFPVDFYIIDMKSDGALDETNMLLGRPFLKTAKTLIDMEKGTLSLKFAGETITFDVNEVMKYPKDSESVCHVSVIDTIVQENFEADSMDDKLNVVLMNGLTNMNASVQNNNIAPRYLTEQEYANLDTTFFFG